MHWVCELCATSMLEVSKNKTISCPECRALTTVKDNDARSLSDDFRMLQIREFLKRQSKCSQAEGATAAVVDQIQLNCAYDNMPAKFKCKDCAVVLCDECQQRHKHRKLFDRHEIVRIGQMLCQKHNNDFMYICERCPRLLCVGCVLTECTNHEDDIKQIADVAPHAKKKMKRIISDLKRRIVLVDRHFKPALIEIRRQKDDLTKLKMDIDTHVEYLRTEFQKRIETQGNLFKEEIEERSLALSELESQMERQSTGDVHDLLNAAESAVQSQGIEEMIMTLNNIKYGLPHPLEKPDNTLLQKELKFESEQTLKVGALFNLLNGYDISGMDNDFDNAHKAFIEISDIKLHHMINILLINDGFDIVYTKVGNLALTDFTNENVLLLNECGTIAAETCERGSNGVTLQTPMGITYNHLEDTLLVADYQAGHIVVLDAWSLRHMRTFKLAGFSRPLSIAISSDCCHIAASNDIGTTLCVFNQTGECVKTWQCPEPATVKYIDSNNRIWAACDDTLLAFNFQGKLIQKVDIPTYCTGMSEYHGILLIAVKDGILGYDMRTNTQSTIVTFTTDDFITLGDDVISLTVNETHIVVLFKNGVRRYSICIE